MQETITYFENFGAENTETTLRLALERAKARGISTILLASTRGDTAKRAAEVYAGKGIKLVVVPHQYGFGEGQRFPKELVAELEKKGHVVYFGTMLFHQDNFYGEKAPSVIAQVYRTFCQGMKVAAELVLMATNGGAISIGEKVVVVTGTGRGADTAVVAIAATSTKFHDFKITEIICKPLETRSAPLGEPPRPAAPPAAPAK
jgi:uncharacterized protein